MGIPPNKLVLGKPASQDDVVNSGLVDPFDLGIWTATFEQENPSYQAGFMIW